MTMRYLNFSQPGGPEVLKMQEGPRPIPKEGEVLIRVRAAGINRPDIAQREGRYPPPPGASPLLGLEVSGEVAACGPGVKEWSVGDLVCALTPGGGYAEYCLAPAGHCLPIPAGISLEEAAGIPETYFTVWTNVFERGRLQAGETFLVHGGTSGIGVTSIQLAKAMGAKVITTVGSEEKREACLALGADFAINYKTKDFVEEVKNFTGAQGVDLILDMIGGPYFPRNLDCLNTDGRLVQIAFMQGAEATLHLGKVMMKRLTITGSTLRPQSVERKNEIAAGLRKNVWPLFEAGKVKVVVDRFFPFDQAKEAHQLMESSRHIGKIILVHP